MTAFTLETSSGHSGRQDGIAEECIRKIAGGDREALATLYQETGTAVYAFALSMLKNVHEAEDVQQDVFLKIWQSAAGYQAQGKPMAWIFTITRNFALMRLRDQGREVTMSPEDWQMMFADRTQMSEEDRIVLQSVLEILSQEERSIVMLHTSAQLKHREIAQIMDLPLATVLSKYNRALKKLKKALTGMDAGSEATTRRRQNR
ncbi:MAG: RNA polymerase sigma factor [Lachnospiraceae bacterium]|nr:RNA polymerase sigma factor [Lachnospiraceae bacterium]